MESKIASDVSSAPHDKVVDEAVLRKSVGSNTTNTTQSRDEDDDSLSTCSSVDSNEMMLSLAANSTATIETSNINRGRGRSRSRKKKSGRKNLRTKFILESLYVEISTLKKENEMLKEILGNIQPSKDIQDKLEKLGLDNKTSQQGCQVPCTVSVSADADAGSNSDLLEQDLSTSDREWESHIKKGECGSKYNYTEEDTEDEDIHQLLYS